MLVVNPEEDQVIDPRPDTPEVPDVSDPPTVFVWARSVLVDSMETSWLESPPTDQSILSREPSSGRVRPEFPDRHYRLGSRSPYLAGLSKSLRKEFLKRRGILSCCSEQESESGADSSPSPKTPELIDSSRMDSLGGVKEGSYCELDRSSGWGPCSCGGTGGHDLEEIKFSRSCRVAASSA